MLWTRSSALLRAIASAEKPRQDTDSWASVIIWAIAEACASNRSRAVSSMSAYSHCRYFYSFRRIGCVPG